MTLKSLAKQSDEETGMFVELYIVSSLVPVIHQSTTSLLTISQEKKQEQKRNIVHQGNSNSIQTKAKQEETQLGRNHGTLVHHVMCLCVSHNASYYSITLYV